MNERGLIAIETITSFIALIMFTVIITLFVNFAAVQLKAHYALTQMAKELSVYCYALELTGVVDLLRGLEVKAGETRGQVDGALENGFDAFDKFAKGIDALGEGNISGMASEFGSAGSDASELVSTFKQWGANPAKLLKGLMSLGVQMATDTVLDTALGYAIAPSFFEKYMEIETDTGKINALSYLRSMSVYASGYNGEEKSVRFVEWDTNLREGTAGLGLTGSRLLSSGKYDEITLEVTYNVNFRGLFLLPKKMREVNNKSKESITKVVQTVKIKAWVGDGGHYKICPANAPCSFCNSKAAN